MSGEIIIKTVGKQHWHPTHDQAPDFLKNSPSPVSDIFHNNLIPLVITYIHHFHLFQDNIKLHQDSGSTRTYHER